MCFICLMQILLIFEAALNICVVPLQVAIALLAVLPGLAAKSSPWVYSTEDTVPEDTIRVTTLGSGTPDVRRHQVMLQHGNEVLQ